MIVTVQTKRKATPYSSTFMRNLNGPHEAEASKAWIHARLGPKGLLTRWDSRVFVTPEGNREAFPKTPNSKISSLKTHTYDEIHAYNRCTSMRRYASKVLWWGQLVISPLRAEGLSSSFYET
jgi:hypothetical protein